MKKSAIAVAVAAVLAAPVALADVQISGQLQAQLVSVGGDGQGANNRKGLHLSDGGMARNPNSGNWGAINFVASEDLGDGLKALAKYSFNVNAADTNLTGQGQREAYVGLAGGFGAVLAGTLNHPYKTSTIGYDPFVGTFMQARSNGGMGSPLDTILYGSEMNNALAYAGSFGGVKVVAAVVLDEGDKRTAGGGADNTQTNGNHATSFSVNAPVGPVEVAVAYINASKHSAYDRNDLTATKVGVKWASGDLTVAGQYEMLGKGFSAKLATPPADGDNYVNGEDASNVMYVTGSYKMGNNTISASYGVTDKKANTLHYSTTDQKNATYIAVGLVHAMSKNTSAFVGYRATDWGKTSATQDNKETAIGAGLRVKF